ncbi:MAG: DUF2442 domain-containing protein [Planctomycetota bacterium]|nr:MAG: DUF2442 domain-containing protein [Planctomycetota bacterium]
MILHIVRAEHVSGHRVRLWFNDGASGEVDFSDVLDGPIFEPLKEESYFRAFRLEGHTIAWPNGADFAPEYLRELIAAQTAA